MTPKEYSEKLVEEYTTIINDNVHPSARYLITVRTAAIKCAIKHVEGVSGAATHWDNFFNESLTYLKSLL